MTIAEVIARVLHAAQIEESTRDNYIHHIERVVALVERKDEKAVAWLHDVLEDTECTSDVLLDVGIPPRIVEAVVLLTRKHGTTYTEYIADIKQSGNLLALVVKRADLADHLRVDGNCPARLRPRYEAAVKYLKLFGELT